MCVVQAGAWACRALQPGFESRVYRRGTPLCSLHANLCTPLTHPNAWCSSVTWLSNRVPCGLLARACEKDLRHAAADKLTHKKIHARTHTPCVKEQARACHQSIICQLFVNKSPQRCLDSHFFHYSLCLPQTGLRANVTCAFIATCVFVSFLQRHVSSGPFPACIDAVKDPGRHASSRMP